MINNYSEKKEEIVSWLKQFDRLATSRFVGLMGLDYNEIKRILEELEKEGLIKKEEETNSIYWSLNISEIKKEDKVK